MSKLYWMSQLIATDSGENITFTPNTLSSLTSTKVSAAIREVATNKTGVKMSKSVAAGSTTFTFTNSYFTDDMYVDCYSSGEIRLKEYPTYDNSTKTITFKCEELKNDIVFRLVVQF